MKLINSNRELQSLALREQYLPLFPSKLSSSLYSSGNKLLLALFYKGFIPSPQAYANIKKSTYSSELAYLENIKSELINAPFAIIDEKDKYNIVRAHKMKMFNLINVPMNELNKFLKDLEDIFISFWINGELLDPITLQSSLKHTLIVNKNKFKIVTQIDDVLDLLINYSYGIEGQEEEFKALIKNKCISSYLEKKPLIIEYNILEIKAISTYLKVMIQSGLNPYNCLTLYYEKLTEGLKKWLNVNQKTIVPLNRPERKILFELIADLVDDAIQEQYLLGTDNSLREDFDFFNSVYARYHASDYKNNPKINETIIQLSNAVLY
tara:strand:- start:2910 stop:3878 length:969 start_codon:yes stop_codon:yes gene_type:complete